MIISIEAMHLLPHPFEHAGAPSSSQGRLRERQHSSSQLSFGFYRKPAAPPPAAGFFVLTEEYPTAPKAALAIASRLLSRVPDKPVDTKLVVQLCNQTDTAAAEDA
ncbi:hypothetical protein CO659_30730 [Rhizobium sp. S9]|uniref:hypothetical protein n=1 Tax=unclassified Rhizobium TaxID=2613769 RepID=UPI000A270AB6|nr:MULTISPECIES: hypothetical protein [unclassified Rhizobium]PDS94113.1 hypothetical protein CO659_30730 [Rhizobium sp. S9]